MAPQWLEDLRQDLDSGQQQLAELFAQVGEYRVEIHQGCADLEKETANLKEKLAETPEHLTFGRRDLKESIRRSESQLELLRVREQGLAGLAGRLKSWVEEFGAQAAAIDGVMAKAGELAIYPAGSLDRIWIMLQSLFVPSVPIWAVLTAAMTEHSAQMTILQLYEWERDRLLTLAKGAGAAALTVLAGLIAAGFGGKSGTNSVSFFVAAPLVALLLLWGGFVLAGLRSLADQYPLALELVRR